MKSIILGLSILFLSGCSAIGSISQPPSEEEINEARALNSPIAISAIFGERNSADGIEVMISYKNISTKPMKYVYFKVAAYNAVGDAVAGKIRGNTINILKDTGPINPQGWGSFPKWKNAIYQGEATRLGILGADIEFMDGTKTEIKGLIKLKSSIGPIETKPY